MKTFNYTILVMTVVCVGCSSPKDADREYEVPTAAENAAPLPNDAALPEKAVIDPGDVDSGVLINGKLADVSDAPNVSAEYIETQRGTLSITTITVKPPLPEKLFLLFEVVSTRDFVERPVVMRVQAYREEDKIGDEHGFVLGKDARLLAEPVGVIAVPRGFTINILDGITEIPESILLHARADAWLMPEGTDESKLNPLVDTAPDHVSILSNPVRVNFIKEEVAL